MLIRFISTFSLIAAFSLAQFGVLTHEISHYSETVALNTQAVASKNSASTNSSNLINSNKPVQTNRVCEKCVGYAEAANALLSFHSVAIDLIITANDFVSRLPATYFASPLHPYLARAPPLLT